MLLYFVYRFKKKKKERKEKSLRSDVKALKHLCGNNLLGFRDKLFCGLPELLNIPFTGKWCDSKLNLLSIHVLAQSCTWTSVYPIYLRCLLKKKILCFWHKIKPLWAIHSRINGIIMLTCLALKLCWETEYYCVMNYASYLPANLSVDRWKTVHKLCLTGTHYNV